MKPRDGIAVLVLALAALAGSGARAEEPAARDGGLQPYQMVRSLELVQDRIAGGDHAALPMQKKLLELIDARFRNAQGQEFTERRNFDALMVYAMSGGNPETVAASLGGLSLDEADRAATEGVLSYLGGDVAEARRVMASVDPAAHTQDVAAFLALVKGSVVAGDDVKSGLAMLDRARLLAPGTLVEEAALRRTLALAVPSGDVERFTRAAEQYSRRFLRSPYAAQFAETFVAGILALKDSIDLARVEQAVSWMTQEQARTVYLRLARRAAIDGDTALLEFASRRSTGEAEAEAVSDASDARSELYASISSVTSDSVDAVLDRLIEMDASRLSSADRALLEAARTVATEVVAPVNAHAARPPTEGAQSAAAGADDAPIDPLVTSARARLEEIDRLLEESKP
ncbi:MAG: chemotaxis protein MotC [Aquamicrobium sp.]|uniref:chemotaxis protein MotC n=1 Tax=Aquamicrobium sp. TaxID=1872579 RepID=UPI00349E7E04|nr:chemotaxis protein MotC [Aquamicrobium sp.]